MNIRDKLITGTFAIGNDGQKEPTDWKDYAIKLEKEYASQQSSQSLRWVKASERLPLSHGEYHIKIYKSKDALFYDIDKKMFYWLNVNASGKSSREYVNHKDAHIEFEWLEELPSSSVSQSNDEDELWKEAIKICENFIVNISDDENFKAMIGGMVIPKLKQQFSIHKK